MRVFLNAYANYNLGDDLFLKIVADRYKNHNFICMPSNNYNKFSSNLKFKDKIFCKVLCKISDKKIGYYAYKILLNKCKAILTIGGSMFMEKNTKFNYIYNINKPHYILGSNFGPYNTNKFYDEMYEIFSKVEDVCFREEYSYNLFKKLPNIRYASDIVFALNTDDVIITNNKKVVISTIDCSKKTSLEHKEKYENKILDMINLFYKKDYEIIMMSFCKSEGDEEAIESIISKINDKKIKEKITKYYYKGNIKEALDIIGDSQVVVGSRFHANILGLVMNKTIIPIAYSDKTLNVLKDMNFKGKVFDIRDMEKLDVNSITDEDLNYKLDVSFQRKDAERHFEKLDQLLDRKDK